MMIEWIRFWITAVCLTAGLSGFGCAVLGVYRFGYVMNRMHAAGIGDTFGLFFTTLGLAVSSGAVSEMLKLMLQKTRKRKKKLKLEIMLKV